MKYWTLLWSALWRKPSRTLLALGSISVAFTLFGLLHGVSAAIDGVIDTIAANRIRVQSLHGRAGQMPLAYAGQIEKIAGVVAVTPTVFLPGYFQSPENTFVAVAVNASSLNTSLGIRLSPAEAQAFEGIKSAAVVHQALAERFDWRLGDRISFQAGVLKRDRSRNWELEIVGIYDTRDAFLREQVWFRYDYLDEGRAFGRGSVQSFVVRTTRPELNAAVADAIDERFASSGVTTVTQSEREWAMAGMEQAIDFKLLVRAIVGSTLFTLLLVTGNTMMESVRQRIPEFAVLKTVGYSDTKILGFVVSESFLLYLCGAGLGLLLSTTLFPLLAPSSGSERIDMPLSVILQGTGIALAIALLGAAAPVALTRRLSIVDALRRH